LKKNRYNVGVLTVGDEILIGQTVNSNAAFIGSQVAGLGGKLLYSFCCPDDPKIMKEQLEYLLDRVDALIITGGLGPTHDDITKDVLVDFFVDELEDRDDLLKRIKEYFSNRNREMRDVNYELSRFPKKAKAIINNVGTAPGIHYNEKWNGSNKHVFSVPGVPKEMVEMVKGYINETFKKSLASDYLLQKYHTIETSGIGESDLASLIGDVNDILDESSSVAYLPSTSGVRIRIGVECESFDEADKKLKKYSEIISEIIEKYIVGSGEKGKIEEIKKLLIDNDFTLSVAESCTAGMLGAYFTDKPGSAKFFEGGIISYSNDVKIEHLGVDPSTIEYHGAVSEKCAIEMAEGIKSKLVTDISLSVTGIAGPDGGSDDKPVGTVWIGMSTPQKTTAKKFTFGRNRDMNRELSVTYASNILLKYLKSI
jgi:nicotinamide-nucleotide amidase